MVDEREEPKPKPKPEPEPESSEFSRKVGAVANRKIRAQRNPDQVWLGLGMMGLIGWSVVIPTLLGAMVGLWLDKHHSGKHAWTLALMAAGLAVGCLNAWHWVTKEDRAMREELGSGDD